MSGATEPTRSIHEWDAAYVLGALSPDERRLFEEHLAGCAECRASVGELAGLPALLAQVPAPALDEVEPAAAPRPANVPATLLPSLLHRVRRRRTVRRWTLAGTAALAAAAIATAVVLPIQLSAPPRGTTEVTLAQMVASPISADVAVTPRSWGTELSMTCRYANAPAGYASAGDYALYVTDASGRATRVASWSAWPGATIRASGAVDLPKAQLRSIELRDAATNAVLLSSPIG